METNLEKKILERAVLVGLNADCFTSAQTATDETLEELEALLETAGGFCTAKVLQNRHAPDPHSFIGEGKAQEVSMLVEATESTMVIFDNELSPRINLEDPGIYSTSCNIEYSEAQYMLKVFMRHHPRVFIAKGETESSCGPSQLTSEREEREDTHVDWWIYEGAEPEKYFKEVSEDGR